MNTLTIYTDGAAKGNPGPAGAGWVIYNDDGKALVKNHRYLGELTNNQAEYEALLLAIGEAGELGGKELILYSDSELMVRQLKKEYKVKNEGLKPLYTKALLTLSQFRRYTIMYVPREKNKLADSLANKAIEEHFS